MKVYIVYFHGTYATGIGEYEEYGFEGAFFKLEDAKHCADSKNLNERTNYSEHFSYFVKEMEVK